MPLMRAVLVPRFESIQRSENLHEGDLRRRHGHQLGPSFQRCLDLQLGNEVILRRVGVYYHDDVRLFKVVHGGRGDGEAEHAVEGVLPDPIDKVREASDIVVL